MLISLTYSSLFLPLPLPAILDPPIAVVVILLCYFLALWFHFFCFLSIVHPMHAAKPVQLASHLTVILHSVFLFCPFLGSLLSFFKISFRYIATILFLLLAVTVRDSLPYPTEDLTTFWYTILIAFDISFFPRLALICHNASSKINALYCQKK